MLYLLLFIVIAISVAYHEYIFCYYEQLKLSFNKKPNSSITSTDIQQKESVKKNPLDIEFLSADTIWYNDYLITRTSEIYDSLTTFYYATIIKNDTIVFKLDEAGPSPYFTMFALVDAVPNRNKSLVIQQFSGGAHCCFTCMVLDLSDSIHILFDSRDYNDLGYDISFCDIREDSTLVICQSIVAFDYFDRLCHASSPFSTAYFKYDAIKNKYINCNREYSERLLSNINKSIELFKSFSDSINCELYTDNDGIYLSYVLKILIDYVYAGQKEKGWKFYDQWYNLKDKEEMRQKIQKVFENSTIYNLIYNTTEQSK